MRGRRGGDLDEVHGVAGDALYPKRDILQRGGLLGERSLGGGDDAVGLGGGLVEDELRNGEDLFAKDDNGFAEPRGRGRL
jgi:hypothetical protein